MVKPIKKGVCMSVMTISELHEKLNLQTLGITQSNDVYYQLDYEELFQHETAESNNGNERGFLTKSGAITVDTGKFTGRSAQDKYVVEDDVSRDTVWWQKDGSTNKPLSQSAWDHLKGICLNQLSNKSLYVIDGFCGANEDTRISG